MCLQREVREPEVFPSSFRGPPPSAPVAFEAREGNVQENHLENQAVSSESGDSRTGSLLGPGGSHLVKPLR